MQPAPPVCDFYRAHEWDLSIWAAWAFASDTGRFDVDKLTLISQIKTGKQPQGLIVR